MYLPEAFQKKMKAILGEEYDDFLAGFEKPRQLWPAGRIRERSP